MPEYLSPGVYIEEVNYGPGAIQGVGTSMPVFIGFTEKAESARMIGGERVKQDLLNRPQLITNWGQYTESYGGIVDGAYLPHAVYGYFMNGGGRCYVVSVKNVPRALAQLMGADGESYLQIQAAQSGFDGQRLRVRIENDTPKQLSQNGADQPTAEQSGDGDGQTPAAEESLSPFNIIVEYETNSGGWQTKETIRNVTLTEVEQQGGRQVKLAYQTARKPEWITLMAPETTKPLAQIWPRPQAQTLHISTNLLSAPQASDFQGDMETRTGVEGLESIDDITMVVVPDLMNSMGQGQLDLNMVKAVQTMLIGHCEKMGDRVAILDTPPDLKPMEAKTWRMDVTGFDSSYAALYYPWIEVLDPSTNRTIQMPPSGHLAGIWARTDAERGVHKAPANEVVRGATGLAYNVTKGEQDVLNPIGVNCVRAFPGMGIRVWGARTLSSDPSWRYINVRRLFNMVEKSIERGTQWVVFEPNDATLWARIRRDVGAFLVSLWGRGALFGQSPAEAFFVRCDEAINPAHVRDQGQLLIEVGLAPVKPAEFVIFRISQWAESAG